MGEIIQLRERQQAREREQHRARGARSLDRAVALLRDNLAVAAGQLRDASPSERPELLERVERLTALVRYGMRMTEVEHPEAASGVTE
ncbi:MAG: hypothetical protein ACREQE_07205 [Candidatus Binataceae bacterium]